MAANRDKTYICENCHRPKKGKEFYLSNNPKYAARDGLITQCKTCATAFVDNWDSSTFLWILQECDVPWVPDEWNKLMQNYAQNPEKLTGATIIGRYLAKMKLKQHKDYRWKDTEFLMEIKKSQIRESMKQTGYSDNDIAKILAKVNFEVPEDQVIPEEREVLDANIIVKSYMPIEPPPRPEKKLDIELEIEENGAEQKIMPEPMPEDFIVGLPPQPQQSPIIEDYLAIQAEEEANNFDLTEEDKIYLRLKWGKGYKPEEWIWLEQFYEDMMNSYDIQTASHIDTLKLICKTSLKSHQLVDIGDIEGAQKIIKTYNELMKSGNFTAAQNKAEVGEFVDSIGELVEMCEKDGYIERYYVDEPKDEVDFTIKDMQRYTRTLIMEETNLGNMIEQAIKENAKEDEDDDFDVDMSYEDELTDEDFIEYNDFIEEEKRIDANLLEGNDE